MTLKLLRRSTWCGGPEGGKKKAATRPHSEGKLAKGKNGASELFGLQSVYGSLPGCDPGPENMEGSDPNPLEGSGVSIPEVLRDQLGCERSVWVVHLS